MPSRIRTVPLRSRMSRPSIAGISDRRTPAVMMSPSSTRSAGGSAAAAPERDRERLGPPPAPEELQERMVRGPFPPQDRRAEPRALQREPRLLEDIVVDSFREHLVIVLSCAMSLR